MIFSYAPYHEKVEMNHQEIGIRSFFHDCAESPKTGVFPLHWHDCLEIIAVETGWLDVEIDQVTYRVKAEDVAVINPEQLHACVKFCPTATLYCLIVDLNIFRSRYVDTTEERYILPLAKKQLLLPSLVSGNQELRQRIIQCCAVCEAQGPAYQLHAKAITLEILYIFLPNAEKSAPARIWKGANLCPTSGWRKFCGMWMPIMANGLSWMILPNCFTSTSTTYAGFSGSTQAKPCRIT